jgi:hypothetical protein
MEVAFFVKQFFSQFYFFFLFSKQTLINNIKWSKLFLFFSHIKIPIKKKKKNFFL